MICYNWSIRLFNINSKQLLYFKMQNRYGSKTRFFKETSFLLITFWNLFWFPSTWFKVGSHAGNFFIILCKRSKHWVQKWIKFYSQIERDIFTLWRMLFHLRYGQFRIVPLVSHYFSGQTRWKCDRVMNPICDPLFSSVKFTIAPLFYELLKALNQTFWTNT